MKIKGIICSVIVLGSLSISSMKVYGEDSTISEVSSVSEVQASTATVETSSSSETLKKVQETTESTQEEEKDSVTESSETTEQSTVVDESEYDSLGNLQYHHPIRFDDFTLDPPAFRSARSTLSTQQAFINQIASSAKTLASANDLFASVMIAQAIVESGWGGSTLSKAPNHNLFGIKGEYNGQSVIMKTQEWSAEQGWYYVDAKFRKYPSFKESLNDNVTILKKTSFSPGNYYYSGAWKSIAKSYKNATAWLTGKYATAPNYGSTLNTVIENYNLTQYDSTGGSTPNPTPPSKSIPMYRLYNPNNYEHFYTANLSEKNHLVKIGWGKYEGIAWNAPATGAPVYRLYNSTLRDHHYTLDWNEVKVLTTKHKWTYEGVAWYSDTNKGVKIHRLFNPSLRSGSHHYTKDQNEVNVLKTRGWKYEGIGWYAK